MPCHYNAGVLASSADIEKDGKVLLVAILTDGAVSGRPATKQVLDAWIENLPMGAYGYPPGTFPMPFPPAVQFSTLLDETPIGTAGTVQPNLGDFLGVGRGACMIVGKKGVVLTIISGDPARGGDADRAIQCAVKIKDLDPIPVPPC